MGFMVVLHRHLWLTLADLKDTNHKTLLNAPITPSGLFRILNYLEDWLTLAHSRDVLISHTDMLLRHLDSLGPHVNMQKSMQSITYLAVCFNSVEMRACT